MRNFKIKLYTLLTGLFAVAAGAALSGCYETSDSLGGDYLPGSQQLSMGQIDFWGVDKANSELLQKEDVTYDSGMESSRILTTRPYRTARINSARLTTGAIGVQRNSIFGDRRTGFFSQYTPIYGVDDDDYNGFGYKPFVDSVMFYYTLSDFSGDTTKCYTYEVYEVTDDSFLRSSTDTLFNVDYTYPSTALSTEPIFTFKFPDQENGLYVNRGYLRMDIVEGGGGEALINRMMLNPVDGYTQLTNDIYNGEYETFVSNFKGLYIRPKLDAVEESGSGDAGVTYSFDLTGSGFGFYARNLNASDPTFVADTVGMTFAFYDSSVTDVGSVAITTVARDYSTGSAFDNNLSETEVKQTNESGAAINSSADVATNITLYSEGMGGIVTEIMLEKPLFDDLEAAIEEKNLEEDNNYSTMFFNAAKMSVFIDASGAEYDSPLILTPAEADNITDITSRLGLYATYSTYINASDSYTTELVAAYDYNYYSEYVTGTVSDYNGYLNKSLGCYEMNIPLQLQGMWNSYREAVAEKGIDYVEQNWATYSWNKLYVAPIATNLFTPRYTTAKGNIDAGNDTTPIRLQLTYTMVK